MKIVLIGNEGHTFLALNAMRKHPELKLCGISSADVVDRNNVDALCREFGCEFHEDYRSMLDKVKPDVAVVGTRYDLNGQVSLDCLLRGIHCFTEKSIAHTPAMLEKIQKATIATGTQIIGMHAMRYDSHFLAAREAVKAGLIGEPMMVYGRKSYKFGASRPEYYKTRAFYGGTLLWVAVHALDMAMWVAGDIEQICAFHSSKNNFGYGDCESSVAMSFALHNGGVGSITADFFQPMKAEAHGDDQIRFAGEKGVVEVIGGKAYICTHDSPRTELEQPDAREFFTEFCDELSGKGKCLLSMADTFKVTKTALAALAAADAASKAIMS